MRGGDLARPRSPAEALLEQRERLVAEIEALRNKLSGLDLAIQLITTGEGGMPERRLPEIERRQGIADTVQRLLTEAGTQGLNAEEAVETAAREGIDLNRSSVSSLLSRLKKAGSVVYVGKRYVLTALAGPEA